MMFFIFLVMIGLDLLAETRDFNFRALKRNIILLWNSSYSQPRYRVVKFMHVLCKKNFSPSNFDCTLEIFPYKTPKKSIKII